MRHLKTVQRRFNPGFREGEAGAWVLARGRCLCAGLARGSSSHLGCMHVVAARCRAHPRGCGCAVKPRGCCGGCGRARAAACGARRWWTAPGMQRRRSSVGATRAHGGQLSAAAGTRQLELAWLRQMEAKLAAFVTSTGSCPLLAFRAGSLADPNAAAACRSPLLQAPPPPRRLRHKLVCGPACRAAPAGSAPLRRREPLQPPM